MKNIFLLFLFSTSIILSAEAQGQQKAKESGFEKTIALVESNRFLIEVNRAFPLGSKSVDLFSNRGRITITDSIAKGFLPYFGRAFSAIPGEDGGISFDSKMRKKEVKVKDSKKKKHILYSFTVKGRNDTYQLFLDITSDSSCFVSVRSNRKSQIAYDGIIRPLPGETPEH